MIKKTGSNINVSTFHITYSKTPILHFYFCILHDFYILSVSSLPMPTRTKGLEKQMTLTDCSKK